MGIVSDTAYNNYMTAYAPKGVSPYNTHKKNETRSVYHSMIKINKEEPWYLPTTNRDTQNYAIDIKENAHKLHNTIAQLGGFDDEGLFHKKSAYASDENIVSATYIGSDPAADAFKTYSVEVQSLASAQENLGLFLADAPVRLKPDTYSFDISINDMNYEFQFTISEDETNLEVQKRLARLINSSAVGIKVDLAEAEGKTALRLTSESTGLPQDKDKIFHISDENTSKTSGTVAYFGLDYTSREPANAKFLVNGEAYNTSTNRLTIAKAYDVRLRGISQEDTPVTIGLKTDIESLTDNINDLIGGYNKFMQTAQLYTETQKKSKQLVNEAKGIAQHYAEAMQRMGLTLEQDGSISVDRPLLHQTAADTADVSKTFGYLKDFASSLMEKSDEVSINPMNYVEKVMVAYKNPGHNYASPYAMSAYSGMMFNYYC